VCYDDNTLMSDSDDRVMLNGVIRRGVHGLYERMMCVCTSLVVWFKLALQHDFLRLNVGQLL
jgi:hypothetical protein